MAALRGIDISAWQHEPGGKPIDWDAVRDDGVYFVIIKATQGLDYVNPYLTQDARGAEAAGLIVGYYHYAVPHEGDAELQARFALTAIKGLPAPLGVSLDLEEDGTLQHYALSDWAPVFMRTVNSEHENAPIYSYPAFCESLVGFPYGHRLWLALPDDPTPPQYKPYMTQGVAIDVNGIEGKVDSDSLLSTRGIYPVNPPLPTQPQAAAVEQPQTQPGNVPGEASSPATVPESSGAEAAAETAPSQG